MKSKDQVLLEQTYQDIFDCQILEKLFTEAIVDNPSNKLSDIFDENGKMKGEVVNTINKGINEIKTQFPQLKILDYFIVGAAVTYQYTDKSDIDTTIVVPKDMDANEFKTVDKWIEKNIDPKYFFGKRPYQFKISVITRQENQSADSIYDIKTQKWIKEPSSEKTSKDYNTIVNNPQSYERQIYTTAERSIQPILQKLNQQIKKDQSLTNAVKNLINSAYKRYEVVKKFRGKSYGFDKRTNQRISQNWGTGNVLYKFLDREGYMDVFATIKNAIKSNFNIDLNQLSNQLSKVVNDEAGYVV